MAKKAKTNLPHIVKIRKLANVLAAYYGMNKTSGDYTAAKKHLAKTLDNYSLDKSHILEAMPQAKELIRQRSQAFLSGETVAKAV